VVRFDKNCFLGIWEIINIIFELVTLALRRAYAPPLCNTPKRRRSAFVPTSGCRDHYLDQGKTYKTFISVASLLPDQ